MALTRKFLTAMGIEEEKAEEIIKAHVETVDALKEQRDSYKADAEALPGVKEELATLKKAAKENGGDSFEKQYNDLKKEYDDYKAGVETKELNAKKESAYKALLKDAGVSDKRFDSILKVTALDGIELGEDGKIKDAENLTKSIKSEWADFIVAENKQGAKTATPPTNNGGTTKTKEEIMAIKDGVERRKAIAENPGLFGLSSN